MDKKKLWSIYNEFNVKDVNGRVYRDGFEIGKVYATKEEITELLQKWDRPEKAPVVDCRGNVTFNRNHMTAYEIEVPDISDFQLPSYVTGRM